MDDQVMLRPVTEADLPMLHKLTQDPEATGEFEWAGWSDPHGWRRSWEENGLIGPNNQRRRHARAGLAQRCVA